MKKLFLLSALLTVTAHGNSIADKSPTPSYNATHTILDLNNCDNDIIRDKQSLEKFFALIGKVYNLTWEPILIHTGENSETAGYLVLAHTDYVTCVMRIHNATNSVHMDFIHMHAYTPTSLAQLACAYFKTSACTKQVVTRKYNEKR